jgi:DNA-binding beta-propeller fold protein YncE
MGPGYFNDIWGVAVDSAGLVYIADSLNDRVQVLTQDGKFVRSFGNDGAPSARLKAPFGIAVAEDGNVYVTDTGNCRVQVYDAAGHGVRTFGEYGSCPSCLVEPRAVAVHDEEVYVADSASNRIVVFTRNGTFVHAFGSTGTANGEFRRPEGVATDTNGDIFVADSGNNRIQKFTNSGGFLLSWGAFGSHSGLLASPTALTVSGNEVIVADLVNHRLQVFDLDGKYLYQWGRHPVTAHEGNGRIHYPTAVSTDRLGDTIVCESFENRCQVFSPEQIRLARKVNLNDSAWWDKASRFHYGDRGSTGGKGSSARMAITEADTHNVLLFDISADAPRFVTKFGGQGVNPGQFTSPAGSFIDSASERITVVDAGNNRLQVFDTSEAFASAPPLPAPAPPPPPGTNAAATTAASPAPAVAANPGAALPTVRLVQTIDTNTLGTSPSGTPTHNVGILPLGGGVRFAPAALKKDKEGQLYMLDPHGSRVVVVDSDFKTVATWGKFGTGKGSFRMPLDLSFSKDGKTVYVVDSYNCRVQAFTTKGKFLFSWGKCGPNQSEFINPFGIASGVDGFVYVTDVGTHRVQKFDEHGRFVKQWGRWGPAEGEFYKPKGIVQDENGRLFVVDFGNHRGQVFTSDGEFITQFGIGDQIYKDFRAGANR